jgi:chemotaxis protein CheD
VKLIVGVADMKISAQCDDVLVTHALGSCLGVVAYDPQAGVGGMLHVMLPQSSINPEKAQTNPCMFVDTGLTAFFQGLYDAGAAKGRLKVKVAGGGSINCDGTDRFAIGKRNCVMLKKLLWQNGVLITAEDTGGTFARTMYLEIGTGRTWLSTGGQQKEL